MHKPCGSWAQAFSRWGHNSNTRWRRARRAPRCRLRTLRPPPPPPFPCATVIRRTAVLTTTSSRPWDIREAGLDQLLLLLLCSTSCRPYSASDEPRRRGCDPSAQSVFISPCRLLPTDCEPAVGCLKVWRNCTLYCELYRCQDLRLSLLRPISHSKTR